MFSVASAFIIFGIIDNGVMVLSGSAIENYLGHLFGISTMASAGLGNTLSDIVGIVCGRYIEKIIFKYVKKEEGELTRFQIIFSEAVGITFGCLIGMSPLLFL